MKFKKYLKKYPYTTFNKKQIIVAILLGMIMGVTVGYMLGSYFTVKAVAEISKGFVDEDLIRQAITQYRHHIMTCYQ